MLLFYILKNGAAKRNNVSMSNGSHTFHRSLANRKESNMKHFLFIIMAIAFAVSAEAADVGVSISVGQPGFYGHIDIGNFPKPQLIYPKPVVIVPAPMGVAPPSPVYIHVPPGQEKRWKRNCHKYNACDRPVYFVHDQWYNNVYVPEYQKRHGHSGGRGDRDNDQGNRGQGKGHGRDQGKDHNRD
jgi:hypothetical protein